MNHLSKHLRRGVGSTAVVAAVLLLGACGSDTESAAAADSQSQTQDSSASDSSTDAAAQVELRDAYVKAAESGMTAGFGTLVNDGDSEITVVSASTPASSVVELHETVSGDGGMSMRPIDGGFVVPAGGSRELSPGGDHVMLMDLTGPVTPGDDVPLTLELSDGSTVELDAVVKDVAGGEEEYVGDMDMGDMDSKKGSEKDGGMGGMEP